ncbi:MAG: type II secretion system protein [Planctomycetota bacterium]
MHRPPASPLPRRGGFSLIEVLVVTGIVSLLIAILMPTLSAARDNGRAVVCANNLRQLGIGFALAIDDHPGHRYPPRQFNCAAYDPGLADAGYPGSWVQSTAGYFSIPVEDFAVCPSDASPYWDQPTPGFDGVYRRVSYGVNPYASLSGGVVNEPQHNFVTDMHEVQRPSAFVGVGELPQHAPRFAVADYLDTPGLVAAAITDPDPAESGLERAYHGYAAARMHDNAAPNWLFLDGHVERLGRRDVVSLPEPAAAADPLAVPYDTYDWAANKLHPVVAR